LTPCMVRVTFAGPELEGLVVDQPAASARLLLPLPPTRELVVPTWTGNEFLLPDGQRPVIRTFTPLGSESELAFDVVIHDGGIASEWASVAAAGDPAAVSGPGRGYVVDPEAERYVLAGDETAIPAIRQLLDAFAPSTAVSVFLDVRPEARQELPCHPNAMIEWSGSLFTAIRDQEITPRTHVWAAGEAAAMQAIRRHLFEERGIARRQATIRGYWKHGRTGDSDDD
jgi:NADPH-dependent ferric siderophore reductase